MAKKKVKKSAKKNVGGSKNPWFRRRASAPAKKGSWGIIPINWKGWISLALLIIINVFAALYFNLIILEGSRWAKFGVVFLLSMLVFILISKNKTLGVKDDI